LDVLFFYDHKAILTSPEFDFPGKSCIWGLARTAEAGICQKPFTAFISY